MAINTVNLCAIRSAETTVNACLQIACTDMMWGSSMGYLKHIISPCVCAVMHTLGHQRSTKNTYLRSLPQQGAFSGLHIHVMWSVSRMTRSASKTTMYSLHCNRNLQNHALPQLQKCAPADRPPWNAACEHQPRLSQHAA